MALPTFTLDQIANQLTTNYWLSIGSSPSRFPSSSITVNLVGVSAGEVTLIRRALSTWQAVANITFTEVVGAADILFTNVSSGAFTNSSDTTIGGVTFTTAATVNVGPDFLAMGLDLHGYVEQTYIHEIGHALGLGHAGNYDGNAVYGVSNHYANDSWAFSVMSYFDQQVTGYGSYATLTTPQLADIVAIQRLYGAGTANTGNTIYGAGTNAPDQYAFNSGGPLLTRNNYTTAFTIYDTGGTDTFDTSDTAGAVTINLNQAAFSSVYGAVNNVAIALGTVIENATGGGGDDTIIGNSSNNILNGNSGNDNISGMGGNDLILGGSGINTVDGGAGFDKLSISSNWFGPDGIFNYTRTRTSTGWVLTGLGTTTTLSNIEALVFNDLTFSVKGNSSRMDLNGDGTSDLLIGQVGSGALGAWTVKNGGQSGGFNLNNPAAYGYTFVGPGDFNGDGTTDLLIKNSATGSLGAWIVANGSQSGGFNLNNPTAYNHTVIGTGDFNGDGTTDLLIKNNATGALAAWRVANGGQSGGFNLNNPTSYNHTVVGTGDFNGDGTTDLLIKNNATGALAAWIVTNGSQSGGFNLNNPTAYGHSFVGTGYFDSDGITDLLIKNNATGALAAWIVTNGSQSGGFNLNNPTSYGYSFSGTGDFNGDGTTDLLISSNATGALAAWTVTSGVQAGGFNLNNPSAYGSSLVPYDPLFT